MQSWRNEERPDQVVNSSLFGVGHLDVPHHGHAVEGDLISEGLGLLNQSPGADGNDGDAFTVFVGAASATLGPLSGAHPEPQQHRSGGVTEGVTDINLFTVG